MCYPTNPWLILDESLTNHPSWSLYVVTSLIALARKKTGFGRVRTDCTCINVYIYILRNCVDWTGPCRTGLDWPGLDLGWTVGVCWNGLDGHDLDMTGSILHELDWNGLNWTGLRWTGLNCLLRMLFRSVGIELQSRVEK